MFTLRLIALTAFVVVLIPAHAQTDVTAAITMTHFDAKDMDTNGDRLISRDEMQAYAEKMWKEMSNGKATIPIALSTKDFATAGVNMSAKEMDTDNDGSISKQEFIAYTLKKYDAMPKTNGMVPVDELQKAFARALKN